jgi:hypothetical protein
MNTYANQWMVAVALKQAYPLVRDTRGGATGDYGDAELTPTQKKHQTQVALWSGLGGAAAGVALMYLVLSLPD